MYLVAAAVLFGTVLLAKFQNAGSAPMFTENNPVLEAYKSARAVDMIEIGNYNHKSAVIADLYYANGLYRAAWFRLREAAMHHDPAAAYSLAYLYRNMEKNPELAVFWAEKAKSWAASSSQYNIYLLADKFLKELPGPRQK